MRDNYNRQLELLNTELKEMGEICILSLETLQIIFTKALLTQEQISELKAKVRHYETEIDHKERIAEDLCMRLILHEQPVAGDLRRISSAHKMISDMERIGDQAYDIAELSDYITGNDCGIAHIRELFEAAAMQVKNAVSAFNENNLNLALNVIRDDDIVDRLFIKVKSELIKVIKTSGEGESCLDLLMTAKYLERVGDHAVNIAKWVEYSVTGAH